MDRNEDKNSHKNMTGSRGYRRQIRRLKRQRCFLAVLAALLLAAVVIQGIFLWRLSPGGETNSEPAGETQPQITIETEASTEPSAAETGAQNAGETEEPAEPSAEEPQIQITLETEGEAAAGELQDTAADDAAGTP